MITIRKAEDRGHFDHGWLLTYHSFSFASYFDPAHMGFGPLRVINDDFVKMGQGFGMHGHRDMEIITYMLEGTLQHKDSMGNSRNIRAGEIQRMAAGTGVRHSEYNASRVDGDDVHLLQIWIMPNKAGVEPEYEYREIPFAEKLGKLKLIASPDSREGSMRIHQDALVYCAVLESGMEVVSNMDVGRKAYVHVATGECEVCGISARGGDGFAISGESVLKIRGTGNCELILFDLP
jgi:redox-sensitive bicupin YhaK (pirin superfamily)